MFSTLVIAALIGQMSFVWGSHSFKFSPTFKVLQTIAVFFIVLLVLMMINGA